MKIMRKVIVSITIVCIVAILTGCLNNIEEISIPTGEDNTSVQVSKNEDGEVTQTFTDEDGVVVTATTTVVIPEGFPDYIPIPEEAEVVSAVDSTTEKVEAFIVQLLIPEEEDITQLVDVYGSFMKEYGYEVPNEISSGNRYTVVGSKGDEVIMINISVYDQGIVIMINVGEGEF